MSFTLDHPNMFYKGYGGYLPKPGMGEPLHPMLETQPQKMSRDVDGRQRSSYIIGSFEEERLELNLRPIGDPLSESYMANPRRYYEYCWTIWSENDDAMGGKRLCGTVHRKPDLAARQALPWI